MIVTGKSTHQIWVNHCATEAYGQCMMWDTKCLSVCCPVFICKSGLKTRSLGLNTLGAALSLGSSCHQFVLVNYQTTSVYSLIWRNGEAMGRTCNPWFTRLVLEILLKSSEEAKKKWQDR